MVKYFNIYFLGIFHINRANRSSAEIQRRILNFPFFVFLDEVENSIDDYISALRGEFTCRFDLIIADMRQGVLTHPPASLIPGSFSRSVRERRRYCRVLFFFCTKDPIKLHKGLFLSPIQKFVANISLKEKPALGAPQRALCIAANSPQTILLFASTLVHSHYSPYEMFYASSFHSASISLRIISVKSQRTISHGRIPIFSLLIHSVVKRRIRAFYPKR